MPIFKRLLGNFLIFTTFPPEDSLGLFVCYEGHIQDVKTAEIVFVAICLRLTPFFFHKMPVLIGLQCSRKLIRGTWQPTRGTWRPGTWRAGYMAAGNPCKHPYIVQPTYCGALFRVTDVIRLLL